jgi:hypothetical protein
VLVAGLVGTAVLAVEGAIVAMRVQLDLLGVMVIAFIVARVPDVAVVVGRLWVAVAQDHRCLKYNPCGSGLARESGGSVNKPVG